MKRTLLYILILACVAGCDSTASLQKLRRAEISGSPFQQALATLYRNFSESELKLYDWWSSRYFADKGLMAAYGQDVEPENPDNWDLGGQRTELVAAREALMVKLGGDYKLTRPQEAARLQFTYDCWLEQLEEGSDEDEIDACKYDFYRLLDGRSAPSAQRDDGSPASTFQTTISDSYVLNFPWDSEEIESAVADELRDVAKVLSAKGDYRVVINGHADRSGSDDYNMRLSQRRADVISAFLARNGIKADKVEYYAFGESDPLIATDDGVREVSNRRVEIFIE